MREPQGVLRVRSHESLGRSGGILPSLRTAYSLEQRRALWSLAMSNPTPERYASEKARILGGE